MNNPNTAYVEVLARLLCAADVHVHGSDHPTWQKLVGEPGQRIRDDYRKAAAWLAARLAVSAQPAAVLPPVDRAAVLREAATAIDHLRATMLAPPVADSYATGLTGAANHLRRMADEEQPATEARPRRGDAFEQWLKTQRDQYDRHGESSEFWHELDGILDRYRLHADTGTPLGEHVCEGRVVGDCECLETER